jgi:hypothetical protein
VTDQEREAWRRYLVAEKPALLERIRRAGLTPYSGAYDSWSEFTSRDTRTTDVAVETIIGVIELINEQMPGFLVVPAKYLSQVP